MLQKLTIYILALLLFSCEKIIDLNLKNAPQRIVIEGTITDKEKQCYVFISSTQTIDEINRFEGVQGGAVSITDSRNNTYRLTEVEKGIYYNESLKATPGETYYLKVKVGNEIYTASSTMPPTKVNLDSITVTYNTIYSNYTTTAHYTDPANEDNQYLFSIYKNSKKYNSFYVVNDEYSNGKTVKQNLPIFSKEKEDLIYKGDTVKVRMNCIDKNIYKYWYSLEAGARGGTGGPGSFGSPGNPVSNIYGGALGYFSAQTNQTQTSVVK